MKKKIIISITLTLIILAGHLIAVYGQQKQINSIKFGRLQPPAGSRLHVSAYILDDEILQTSPGACDYTKLAMPVLKDSFLNYQLGDCVIAGAYHAPVGTATGNARHLFHATKAQIVADYSRICGYKPGHPETDNGCDMPAAMNYWQKHGFADGTKIVGWFDIDPSNIGQIKLAIYLFENLYFGMNMPYAWVDPAPNSNGFIWDVAGEPDQNLSHCVSGVAYTNDGVIIDTWGLKGLITWAAIAKYCAANVGGELHVMVTPDVLIRGTQKAPNGIAWQTLIADANAMGANIPVKHHKTNALAENTSDQTDQADDHIFQSKFVTVHYSDSDQLESFAKKIHASAFTRTLNQVLVGRGGRLSSQSELGEFLDELLERVQLVLDMPTLNSHVEIQIHENIEEVSAVYSQITGGYSDAPSFYCRKTNTIHIQTQHLTVGMLTHELGHAVMGHYFAIQPPEKISEMLSQYVDKEIEAGNF